MDMIARDLWPELNPDDRDVLMSLCCSEEQYALKNNTLDITYPSVIETIQSLSVKENFFVVSNCQSGYIELMLEKTGLGSCVKDFECYGNTHKGKAENILLLSQRNQLVSPIYIGDTQGDSDACKQCGVPFIWASYGFGTSDSYIEKLSRFSELASLLGD